MVITRYRYHCFSTLPLRSFQNPGISAPKPHQPDLQTTLSHLHSCSQWTELKSIHATLIKNNTHQDPFIINQFITACSSFHRMDHAFLSFTQMEEPNVYVYNALIRGFVRCSSPVSALRSYVTMSRSQVEPTSYTFPSLIKACALASAIGFGESVHGRTYKGGFGSHVFVQASLIDFYSSSRKIEESKRVFDGMRERDAFSWAAMISAYVRVGDMNCAVMLFEEMPEKTTVSWNVIIGGHAKAGDVELAASLFDRMPGKDSVSWTSMISCYSQSKKYREAIETFKRMKDAKVSPDGVTMATVISACAHLGALKLGRELHLEMNRNGCDLDVYIGSALIDMYAKCGDMERSLLVFFKLHEKNLFCWNSLIEGLAFHGHGKAALAMFHKMKQEKKILPNRVTFVSVLSACVHSGLVIEGRRIFNSMTSDHSIIPGVEHYGCMVDLLGRAGQIEEALQMIQAMEVEPNSAVWGALLGGCKLHQNLDIGRMAVKELIALEPDNCGYYLLLTNMYAEAKWWSKVAGVQATMRGRGVEKDNKGLSWIEMEGVVYEFTACGASHPQTEAIFSVLVELVEQMKLSKYGPDWWFSIS